eukprot:17150_1
MMFHLLCSWSLLIHTTASISSNEFDTYNPDACKRVRRSWLTLDTSERQLYIDALMELRQSGQGDVLMDELVAIGSEHENFYGEVTHTASLFLFWHGYLLWELESRIRNLGGKYACFAVPYWDFSTEADRETKTPLIWDDIIGGTGDPDNHYTVNGYSWDYTTQQYWVPAHCDAEDDEYPICSLKRATSDARPPSADVIGSLIMENTNFEDFSKEYATKINLPHLMLTNVEYLTFPVITSYDPLWFLFHSMVSYHQAIWTDCNEYDLIPPADLDAHADAYTAYCIEGNECGEVGLDDAMFFGGYLSDKSWAFVHDEELTVRKSYHFPRWNIIYDLGDGLGFYSRSRLDEFCKGKLNSEWFILNDEANDEILNNDVLSWHRYSASTSTSLSMLGFAVLITVSLLCWSLNKNKNKDESIWFDAQKYGSV